MQKSIKSPSEEAIHLGAYEENCKKSCILQDIIQYFDTNRDAVYYFQDPISGHIYFDTCTNCEECWLAEQLECDVLDLCSKKNRSKRSKPVDPVSFEPRPCKPDPEPRQPDADDFTSSKSSFDGYKIPTSWVYQTPKPSKVLHPYYQKCLEILEKEAREQNKKKLSFH